MSKEIKAFYQKKDKPTGRPKFVYVRLAPEQAKQFIGKDSHGHVQSLLGDDIKCKNSMHDDEVLNTCSDEVHLTTDGAWDRYIEKRLCIPKFVFIANTQTVLSMLLEKYGFIL
jgi:hypothetical protein